MKQFFGAFVSLAASITWAADALPLARLSQVGFDSASNKIVVLARQADGKFRTGEWQLLDASPKGQKKIVAHGILPQPTYWNAIADSAQPITLPVNLPKGNYRLVQGKDRLSAEITVDAGRNAHLVRMGMKAFYHNRASTATDSVYAGKWARSAGHPDTLVKRHSSTGQTGTLSAPKGWYDAGDYGKYIVNSGISTWLLLDLFETAPTVFDTLKWGIPPGPDPELLREIRWNLDWMLAMQDADGGVYSKLTTLLFDRFERPDQDHGDRYVMMKTTAASLDFALVMAKSSRLWKDRDTIFSRRCLESAKRAWAWSVANPNILYAQPSDVETGEYGDNMVTDERFAAAAELALATSDTGLFVPFRSHIQQHGNRAWWRDVGAVGLYTILSHPGFFTTEQNSARRTLTDSAAKFLHRVQATGYASSMDSTEFVWGSNSDLCMQGIHMLQAFKATGDSAYLAGAEADLDYVLGRNPTDSTFVTGVGVRAPRHPHHRPSSSDTVAAPVPGFLVGGAHQGGYDIGSNPWQCKDYRKPGKPALSWSDEERSYASNEVAINWNASLVYLAGSIALVRKSLP